MQIEYSATEDVRAAIARLERTEDVQFAPGGGRLAVTAFNENRLLVLGIDVGSHAEPPTIVITSWLELESDALRQPHGLSWIDERTIAVANRNGQLSIFELPSQPASGSISLAPVKTLGIDSSDLLKTPGSVSTTAAGADLIEFVVCNNYVHHVSRHLIDRRSGYAPIASEVLIRDGVTVPDGVAHSPCGRWIAISNHGHHNVLLFRNDRDLGPRTRPQAVLCGMNYPHGVHFPENGRSILVADAGAPFVHFYRSEGDWTGEHQPETSIRVLTDESFKRGNKDPTTGGPKGIDVTADGRVMVVSCQEEPIAFFDLQKLIAPREAVVPEDASEAEVARESILRYMAFDQLKMDEATAAIRRANEFEMAILTHSRSWRITAPLRWAVAASRRVTPAWMTKHL
jgi:hypothetical protein